MPSNLAVTLGLLRFGALPASEKLRVLGDYQARCDSSGGHPHVWNPSVEVIESLWSFTTSGASETNGGIGCKAEDRALLREIAGVAENLLADQCALVDGSAFQTPDGQTLSVLCAKAVSRLGSDGVEELSFWDLLCHTCD